MTIHEIEERQKTLAKAINLAQTRGWKHDGIVNYVTPGLYVEWFYDFGELDTEPYQRIIFSHDFAKALWGDGCWNCLEGIDEDDHFHNVSWEHHLREMVIAEDPIKYLGENLDN